MSSDLVDVVMLFSGCAILAACLYSAHLAMRDRARRRMKELTAVDKALQAHYAALSKLADDPATPTEVLVFLDDFSDAISSEEMCELLAPRLIDRKRSKSLPSAPDWADGMEALEKSRPDLVEQLHVAVSTGLVALYLRWPATAKLFNDMVAEFAAAGRREEREAKFADDVVRLSKHGSNRKRRGDHDDFISNGLMPA